MKRFIITIFSLLFTLFSNVSAQDVKQPESYNYVRGIESVEAKNYKEAMEFFKKEIVENPKNGYAYAWMSVINQHYEDYGRAISEIDLAIKYLPKKDKSYRSWAYNTKSQLYEALGDMDKALAYMSKAIEISPEDKDWYEKRAQLYFEMEQYDSADQDYNKILSLDAGNVLAYMGLGRNEKMRKNYDSAIKIFDYVIKLAKDYSSGYSFRSECLIELKRYNEASADIVKALYIDYDNKAFHHMQELAKISLSPIVTRLNIETSKNPTESAWPYYLGIVNEDVDRYDEAIKYYLKSYKLDANPVIAFRLANCYEEVGKFQEAMKYSDITIRCDSTDFDYFLLRASINDNQGKSKDALKDMNKYIELQPEYFFGYYRRGWIKDHTGDYKGAIEDYSTSILLDPTFSYAYINRGVLYKLQGNEDLAKKDFEEVIKRDSLKEEQHTPYALFYLGKKNEAKDFMDTLLNKREDKSTCYEAACLYSLMKEEKQALEYLRKALEYGNKKFNHIRRDRDLEFIRRSKGFEKLINEFETIEKEESNTDVGQEQKTIKTVEVPFVKSNGICKVKCTINKLPLHFIFDTGASDVSISNVEASFMLKNEYLKKSDIRGTQNYLTADGDISEGTIINLRDVMFGGLHLENVKASVVKNQKAPLLLGQSVLNRLGKIEIDNDNKILKITYKE